VQEVKDQAVLNRMIEDMLAKAKPAPAPAANKKRVAAGAQKK